MNVSCKTKIIITMIISFIIILLGANYCMANEYPLSYFETKWGYDISWAYTLSADNIYCIQKGNRWIRDTNYLNCWHRVEITDGVAKFYEGEEGNKLLKTYEGQFDEEYGVIDNNLIAAIFYYGQGHKNGGDQDAVNKYLERWLARAKFRGEYQINYFIGDSSCEVNKRFIKYANKNVCDVIIYFLVNTKDDNQNLALVIRRGKRKNRLCISNKKMG